MKTHTRQPDSSRLRRLSALLRHPACKPLLFLAATTLLFFWPLWIARYRFPIGGGDLWGQLHPVWSYVAQWLRRGSFPLWHTGLMAGDPILAEGQYGLFYPLNWPMFLFSPVPAWIVSLRGMFTLWLAGAGLYLYLRYSPVWQTSRVAALIGALAYMFSDPFVAHLGHPQFNDAMAWLPWTLWAVDGAMRRKRIIPLAGVALALMLLSGHGQASLYGALTVGAYSLWQIFDGGLRCVPRRTGRLVLVALLAAGLAMPGVLPGLERLPYSERALVPWDLRRGYEFRPELLLNLLTPDFYGRGVGGYWPAWDRVEGGYVGAVALFFAILGLASNLGRRRTWFLVGLGLLAYLFALGYIGSIYPRVAHLPLFAASWKTARMIFVLSFTLAIGAALGVDALNTRPRFWLWGWGAALLGGGLVLWFRAPGWVLGVPEGVSRSRALAGLRFTAVLAWGTVLLGWFVAHCRRWAHAALPLLLTAELVALGALVETELVPQTTTPHAAAIKYLRADTGWFRVDVDTTARGLWSPSALQAAGFESPQGAGNPMDLAAFAQFYWAVPYKDAPAYQLFGAKYIVVPKDALPGGDGIWPVFFEDPLVDLHLNTNALPRVWLVYDTLPVTRIEEAYDAIFTEDFAPAQVATVENGPALAGDGSGTLEVLTYAPNRVRIAVHTSAGALLVLSDIFYPGWTAYVDDEATPIYRADGIFRGIHVPQGDHIVEMRFFPTSLRVGLGLAAMASGVILAGLWLWRKQA